MLRFQANALLIDGAALLFDGAALLFDVLFDAAEALLVSWKNCAACDRLLLLTGKLCCLRQASSCSPVNRDRDNQECQFENQIDNGALLFSAFRAACL